MRRLVTPAFKRSSRREASDQMGPWRRPSEFAGEQGYHHGSIIRYLPLGQKLSCCSCCLSLAQVLSLYRYLSI